MGIILAHDSLPRMEFSVPKKKRRTWILLTTSNLSQRWNDLPSLCQDKNERIVLYGIPLLLPYL